MDIQEIKSYMKRNKITQIELSERSGVPLQTIRYLFSGRTSAPRVDTAEAIYKALGIPTAAVPAYSADAIELIEMYNQLSTYDKGRARGFLESLVSPSKY